MPINTAVSNGQTNGNAAENRRLHQASLAGLNLTAGNTLLLRWVDSDSSGNDYGLAIDDFSITASSTAITAVPTPALLPGLLGFGLRLLHRRRKLHKVG
ncbi:MAG: PTPA-CTERM sorting domain-containing protein [Synechococcales cyanobacterium RM1_1_8]|nr:PTPA-CTERM sorting domain-containing protein [Synechococcales cyanobacterium RM1_1_8]